MTAALITIALALAGGLRARHLWAAGRGVVDARFATGNRELHVQGGELALIAELDPRPVSIVHDEEQP